MESTTIRPKVTGDGARPPARGPKYGPDWLPTDLPGHVRAVESEGMRDLCRLAALCREAAAIARAWVAAHPAGCGCDYCTYQAPEKREYLPDLIAVGSNLGYALSILDNLTLGECDQLDPSATDAIR